MRAGLVLIVISLVAPLQAKEKWPIRVAPSREPSPFQYKADLWKKVPKIIPDRCAGLHPLCILCAFG